MGYVDKNHAIIECINKKELDESDRVYRGMNISPDDIEYQTKRLSIRETIPDDMDNHSCAVEFHSVDDCHKTSIFSDPESDGLPGVWQMNGSVTLSSDYGNSPSYVIESKPRIDHVDYVTYILGALGSWLGFSFLAFNPIPYFFNKKGEQGSSSERAHPNSSHRADSFLRNKVSGHDERLLRHRIMLSRMTDDLLDYRHRMARVERLLSLR